MSEVDQLGDAGELKSQKEKTYTTDVKEEGLHGRNVSGRDLEQPSIRIELAASGSDVLVIGVGGKIHEGSTGVQDAGGRGKDGRCAV